MSMRFLRLRWCYLHSPTTKKIKLRLSFGATFNRVAILRTTCDTAHLPSPCAPSSLRRQSRTQRSFTAQSFLPLRYRAIHLPTRPLLLGGTAGRLPDAVNALAHPSPNAATSARRHGSSLTQRRLQEKEKEKERLPRRRRPHPPPHRRPHPPRTVSRRPRRRGYAQVDVGLSDGSCARGSCQAAHPLVHVSVSSPSAL